MTTSTRGAQPTTIGRAVAPALLALAAVLGVVAFEALVLTCLLTAAGAATFFVAYRALGS